MKAVILKGAGDVSQLAVEEIAAPTIEADEMLIRTRYFSINPIEIKTRKGNRFTKKLLADKPSILGWDLGGVVEKVGKNVKGFSQGDPVFGVIGFPDFGKTYAEYVAARPKDVCKIPENVDFDQASVCTIAGLTAYQALKYHGKLAPGKRVLIHAASGGVGHLGVQLAKHFGAEVFATASGGKKEFVKSLGADHFIDYKTQNFEEEIQQMDVVFDLIGGNYIDRSLKVLKKGGILISIPSATNAEVEEKAAQQGCTGVRFSMQADQTDLKEIARLLENGTLRPFISNHFTLAQIREAHGALEEGHTKGKIAVEA